MSNLTDVAIVLKRFPYEDRHQMIHAFGLNLGYFTVSAKNSVSSKRFGAALDFLSVSFFELTQKGSADFYNLRSAEIKKRFDQIPVSYSSYETACFFIKTISKIAIPHHVNQELFQLLYNSLNVLNENKIDIHNQEKIISSFYLKLLQATGHNPQVEHCKVCGSKTPTPRVGFSIKSASWFCEGCQPMSSPQSNEMVDWMKKLMNSPIRLSLELQSLDQEIYPKCAKLCQQLAMFHLPGLENG